VEHIPGVDNIVADLYSRLNTIIVLEDHIETVKSTACIPYMLAALTVDNANDDDTLRTLDREEINTILKESHNAYIGHGGVERTLSKVQLILNKEKVFWPSKRADVKEYIKTCPACQFLSDIKIKVNISPYNVTVSAPMERINLDTLGPFEEDEHGNTYIIVQIDVFSRFVELYACKDTSADAAVKSIIQHIGRYGTPSQILTDNGSQYIAELTKQLLKYVDTRHITIFPYSHEENSIVERANKEVTRHLRAILFDTQLKHEWSIILPLVQRIMNSQINKTLGTSPASIIFGNNIDLERNIFKPYVDMSSDNLQLDDYLIRLGKAQSRIVAIAQESQRLANETYIQTRMEVIGDDRTIFEVGSFVLLQFHDSSFVTRRRPSKLSMNYKGPYRVIAQNNNTEYEIENLVNQEILTVHVKELRPFHHDGTINPKDIARHAAGEFFVHSIVDIQGNKNPRHNRYFKKNLLFKVHWLGFDDSYDSWEPYKELRLNKHFHAHCQSNNLAYLIPKNLEE
jgi:transposase InsO family protein